MNKMKLRYINKIPESQVGDTAPIVIKKGDIIEVGEQKAKVLLRDPKKWELVKSKKKEDK